MRTRSDSEEKSRTPRAAAYATTAQRWRALQTRDPAAEGAFVYSVESTGIFCRPNCPSKLAGRTQIKFHDNAQTAKEEGYRPCKRCRPEGISPGIQQKLAVENACRLLEESEDPLSIDKLAGQVGLSRFHFQRLFKRITGVTPGEYARSIKSTRARAALKQETSVTEAIYSAGYGSASRFYESSNKIMGMTPQQYRKGAAGVEIRFAIEKSPLGLVLVAGTARGICLVQFGENRSGLAQSLRREFPNAKLENADRAFQAWVKAVVRHIESPGSDSKLPLDIRGTAFQMRVWQALIEVPAGATTSYSQIAATIGKPRAVRAVANACAANNIAVLIPCHRIVRTNGHLGGYRWGLDRKRKLLQLERADAVK